MTRRLRRMLALLPIASALALAPDGARAGDPSVDLDQADTGKTHDLDEADPD